MKKQVFLGGACGSTTWRRQIAIPALQAAGVTYHDPQLGIGEWTEACEAAEMEAKDAADVLLFVLSSETRGVATVGEIAYYLGSGRRLALAIQDAFCPDPVERDDLNRGRIFVRTMAKQQGVPVFGDVHDAVQNAIQSVRSLYTPLTHDRLTAILSEIQFKPGRFLIHPIEAGFLIQPQWEEQDIQTGLSQPFLGRKWFIDASATEGEVVRTAFKAAVTWQEHEAREQFTYKGVRLFDPHFHLTRA